MAAADTSLDPRMIPRPEKIDPALLLGLPPPVPKEFICPITQELMVDPVFAEDGFSYERLSMERWFSTGKRRSPVTNEVLTDRSTQLTPNRVMKTMIQNYRIEIGSKLLAACSAPAARSDAAAVAMALASGVGQEGVGVRPLTSMALSAFVDAGADLNVRDSDGNTPLLLLLHTGHLELAEELLEFGSKASVRNDVGTAPVDLCMKLRDQGFDELEGGGGIPVVSRADWDRVVTILERVAATEAVASEKAERQREATLAASRARASANDRADAAAEAAQNGGGGAAAPANLADALAQAHIGPGLGFFPSLFALQFQAAAVTPPLQRRDLDSLPRSERQKLLVADNALKAGTAFLILYWLFAI
jgi:hypothetical protein